MNDKIQYTAESAWRFAMNMIFDCKSKEKEWRSQYNGCVYDTTFKEVVDNYNSWLDRVDGYHIGKEVENKDGRVGFLAQIFESVADVLYIDKNSKFELKTESICNLKLTGGYNESVRELMEDRRVSE